MRLFALLLLVGCASSNEPTPEPTADTPADIKAEVTVDDTPDVTVDVTVDPRGSETSEPLKPQECLSVVLSEKEEANLRPIYADMDRKIVHLIPDEELDAYDQGVNKYLLELVDGDCKTIGYAREITTGVGCLGSACAPIHYYECLDADGVHKDVSSYEPDPLYYRKYWESKHVIFDAQDMELTRALVASPPEEYLAVTPCAEGEEDSFDCGPAELVDLPPGGNPDTAPTIPTFVPITVRGGVFTIYKMILYRLATEAIVEGLQ